MTTHSGKFRGLVFAFAVVLAGFVVTATMAALYVGLRAGDQSADNAEVLNRLLELSTDVKTTNDRLLDCTQPPGKCLEESQKRTGEAISGINDRTYRLIVAGIACQSDGITDEKPLARCIVARAQRLQAD